MASDTVVALYSCMKRNSTLCCGKDVFASITTKVFIDVDDAFSGNCWTLPCNIIHVGHGMRCNLYCAIITQPLKSSFDLSNEKTRVTYHGTCAICCGSITAYQYINQTASVTCSQLFPNIVPQWNNTIHYTSPYGCTEIHLSK